MKILAAMIALAGQTLHAQSDPRAELNFPLQQRVRVSAPAVWPAPMAGRVAGADSSHLSLIVSGLGTSVAIPYSAIAGIHASGGMDRARGARRGALAGLALGAYFFATTYPGMREHDVFGAGFLAISLVSFGITPGAGALVGYFLAPERWEPRAVPVPPLTASGVGIRFASEEFVRIRARGGNIAGRVTSQSGTQVTVATGGGSRPVPWTDVTRLQIRGGKDRVKGAAAGALVAIGLGILGERSAPTTSTGERIGAFAGAALVGGYLGSRFLAPRGWTAIPVPAGR